MSSLPAELRELIERINSDPESWYQSDLDNLGQAATELEALQSQLFDMRGVNDAWALECDQKQAEIRRLRAELDASLRSDDFYRLNAYCNELEQRFAACVSLLREAVHAYTHGDIDIQRPSTGRWSLLFHTWYEKAKDACDD